MCYTATAFYHDFDPLLAEAKGIKNYQKQSFLKKFQIIKGVLFDPFSLGQRAQIRLFPVFRSPKGGQKSAERNHAFCEKSLNILGEQEFLHHPFIKLFAGPKSPIACHATKSFRS